MPGDQYSQNNVMCAIMCVFVLSFILGGILGWVTCHSCYTTQDKMSMKERLSQTKKDKDKLSLLKRFSKSKEKSQNVAKAEGSMHSQDPRAGTNETSSDS